MEASSFKGAQGWRQFLQAKRRMLAEFDVARTHGKLHEVETWHGVVAEGLFRRWLADFLPSRFGITSGYIISQNRSEAERAPHFDIIIYDRLNAPVLWIEEHPEVTEAGRSRAIPAEWVRCVFEVKSKFTRATVQAALEHLLDLKPLFEKPSLDDRYASWLKDDFFCAVIFFELTQSDANDPAALKAMLTTEPKRFFGGLILRGEGRDPDASGRIQHAKYSLPGDGMQKNLDLLDLTFYIEPNWPYWGVNINWSQTNFSRFAFDVIALLTGTYTGSFSSFHAMPPTVGATSPSDSGSH